MKICFFILPLVDMPKKRNRYDYSGGKKYRESYGYVPKSTSVGTQTGVDKLKIEVKKLKDFFEKKQHLTSITSAMLAAGSVQMVSNMVQGDTSITREG